MRGQPGGPSVTTAAKRDAEASVANAYAGRVEDTVTARLANAANPCRVCVPHCGYTTTTDDEFVAAVKLLNGVFGMKDRVITNNFLKVAY